MYVHRLQSEKQFDSANSERSEPMKNRIDLSKFEK